MDTDYIDPARLAEWDRAMPSIMPNELTSGAACSDGTSGGTGAALTPGLLERMEREAYDLECMPGEDDQRTGAVMREAIRALSEETRQAAKFAERGMPDMTEFPTIKRLMATPLNETFGYQGPELCAEARRLGALYADILPIYRFGCSVRARLEREADEDAAEIVRLCECVEHNATQINELKGALIDLTVERDEFAAYAGALARKNTGLHNHLSSMCSWVDLLAEKIGWTKDNAGALFDSLRVARELLAENSSPSHGDSAK